MYSKLLVGKKIWCCSLFWWLISFFLDFYWWNNVQCKRIYVKAEKTTSVYLWNKNIFDLQLFFFKRYYYNKQDFYIKICNYFFSCFMYNLCLTNQQIYVGQHHFSNKRRKKKRDLWFSTRKINQSFQQPFENGVDI